jgi:hypothetical protein
LKFCCRALVFALLVTTFAGTAQAANGDTANLDAQKQALFQQMLRNPANLDVAFAYADISARLGDYEAAVSTLERMLLFNPDLPRVQLELGTLYFRMGSYQVARDYFDKAIGANPPPEVRARVEEYLAQIEKRESRHSLSGYLFWGGNYQTDANVAPGSPLILSPIGPVLLNSQFTKQGSGSMFGSGSALYSYDLETQNRNTIEATAVSSLNHFLNPAVTRLDLALLEVTGGPRFNFSDGLLIGGMPASLKPYVIGDEIGLGWNQYFAAIGTGIEYDQTLWGDLLLKGVFEFRQKYFTNAPDRPLSTGLNGNDKLVTLSATKPVSQNSAVSLEFDYLDQSTQLPYYSNNSYAVSGSYRIRYDDPIGITAGPWESTAYLGRAWSNYAAPDPCCVTTSTPQTVAYPSGFSSQLTQRWRFGLTQTWPISANSAIVLQVERNIVSSNLPLYAYTNTSVVIGPQVRF